MFCIDSVPKLFWQNCIIFNVLQCIIINVCILWTTVIEKCCACSKPFICAMIEFRCAQWSVIIKQCRYSNGWLHLMKSDTKVHRELLLKLVSWFVEKLNMTTLVSIPKLHSPSFAETLFMLFEILHTWWLNKLKKLKWMFAQSSCRDYKHSYLKHCFLFFPSYRENNTHIATGDVNLEVYETSEIPIQILAQL